ncbi:hypothetical protein MPSEU_000559400 [Mayamaea pseudoterrestris]|nr:hypothetical protein MPSEU_000559400 [Mayamaea pseudoterrestris]
MSNESSNQKENTDEVELASFLVPPLSEAPSDMMSYHIEASKRLTRIEERERDRRRVIRLPPGWDKQKLKQTLKLALAAIVSLCVTIRIFRHFHSARQEQHQQQLARQPVVYKGHTLLPEVVEKVLQYRKKTALIVNLHLGIMHSSTEYKDDVIYQNIVNDEDYVCKVIGHAYLLDQQAPRFHCRIDIHQDKLRIKPGPYFPFTAPWSFDDTADNIQAVRKFWHMIDWYSNDVDVIKETLDSVATTDDAGRAQQHFLADTNWKDPNLISILVMVDPMERLLTDAWAFFERTYPVDNVLEITLDRSFGSKPWWSFIEENPTNNVVEQLGQRHKDTKRVRPAVLTSHAQELMKEFTFVLDSACLEQGITKVADILNIPIDEPLPERTNTTWTPSTSMPADVYQRLTQLSKLNIDLYKWSKTISLVQC